MFKRATWLTVGFSLGVGTTVAAAHQVRKRINRYQPRAMANRVTDSLSSLRDQVAEAVDEGRTRLGRASRSCALAHPGVEEARRALRARAVRFVPWRRLERLTNSVLRSPASSPRAATPWCRRRA